MKKQPLKEEELDEGQKFKLKRLHDADKTLSNIKERRSFMTAHEAVRKITNYLEQSEQILQRDLKRHEDHESLRKITKIKLDTIDGLLIWINHNV